MQALIRPKVSRWRRCAPGPEISPRSILSFCLLKKSMNLGP